MTTAHSFSDLLVSEKTDVPTAVEESSSIKEQGASFPPIDDTIIWWNNIDWVEQRQRARSGINNCGLVLAVIGTKVNELGTWLAKV